MRYGFDAKRIAFDELSLSKTDNEVNYNELYYSIMVHISREKPDRLIISTNGFRGDQKFNHVIDDVKKNAQVQRVVVF